MMLAGALALMLVGGIFGIGLGAVLAERGRLRRDLAAEADRKRVNDLLLHDAHDRLGRL